MKKMISKRNNKIWIKFSVVLFDSVRCDAVSPVVCADCADQTLLHARTLDTAVGAASSLVARASHVLILTKELEMREAALAIIRVAILLKYGMQKVRQSAARV